MGFNSNDPLSHEENYMYDEIDIRYACTRGLYIGSAIGFIFGIVITIGTLAYLGTAVY